MKKLTFLTILAVCWVAMSQAQTSALYTAGYSSKFKMAEQSYADKILTLWKDFENNTLDGHSDWIADTVTMILADGKVVKGKADNLAGAKAYRGSIKNYKVSIDAWMSVKSVDRNQNAVCVWGNEDFTDADGKHITQRIQEVWTFNKDGKVDMMLQYVGGGSM